MLYNTYKRLKLDGISIMQHLIYSKRAERTTQLVYNMTSKNLYLHEHEYSLPKVKNIKNDRSDSRYFVHDYWPWTILTILRILLDPGVEN